MAIVSIGKISSVKVNAISEERGLEGKMAFDKRILDMYKAKGYDGAPKTKEESVARGVKGFNGLSSSVVELERNNLKYGWENLTVHLAPARYLYSQAMRDYVKENKLGIEEMQRISPKMANVSLLVPIGYGNSYYLLAQVKGEALGQGQILAALAAGGVDAKHLSGEKNPLIAALKAECSEEVGLDLTTVNSESFAFFVDEYELGNVNFAAVAMRVELQQILDAYDKSARAKLANKEKLEVAGLALLPIQGQLGEVKCFFPSPTGLQEKMEKREVRPYTLAVREHLANGENLNILLNKADLLPW